MFLDELDLRQRCSFLALATRIVLADGDVAPEEDVVLNALKIELGDGVLAPAEEVFGATNAAVFQTQRSRRIAFLELLVLVHADAKLHPDESTVLAEISKAFDLDDVIIEKIDRWAREFSTNSNNMKSDDANLDGNRRRLIAQAETLISE